MGRKLRTVSVIIPTYNCAEFIEEAVKSALSQSYRNCEIIVVDDGSTDNTKEALFSYISFGQVYYYYQENGGIAKARNFGISKAAGEYILLLDADDKLMPKAIQETVQSIEKDNSGWVIADNIRVENGIEQVIQPRLPKNRDAVFDAIENPPNYNAVLFDKEVLQEIGGYDPEQKVYEDWDLYIRLLKRAIPYSYVNKPLYRYQIRRGSVTKRKNIRRNLKYMERIYRKHCRSLLQEKNQTMRQIYSAKMWRLASSYFHKTGSYLDVFRCLIESVRYDRKSLKEYIVKFFPSSIYKDKFKYKKILRKTV